MTKKRILLTGGGGMVGRNLLEHPAISDFEVLAPRSTELNLCDFVAVKAYLHKHQPDMVIHAAGKVGGIQANMREPVSFLVENLEMGKNVVLASHHAGVKQLLNLGSSCMYPRNHYEPLRESMVLQGELEPTNEGYALAKAMTARLCGYIVRENPDYSYKTLIPCNVYGRYDKFNPSHSHLIPAIIHKLHQAKQKGLKSVEIWGDGTARREFMYAADLADLIVRAIKDFDSLPDVMNVGLGHDYSVSDYYQAVAEVIGYKGKFTYDTTKPVGMARKLVNIDRQKSWGWVAKTSLNFGIKNTYEYYLESLNKIDADTDTEKSVKTLENYEPIYSRALVIGGLGFIGSSLVSRLVSRGVKVDITTSKKNPSDSLSHSSVFQISYDEPGFDSVLSKNEYDDIYFMSGNPSPSNSEKDSYLDVNLTNLPLLALLNVAAKKGFTGRLWFASSVAVYGENSSLFLSENSECRPLSYYAVSKLMAEEHLKLYNRIYGLKTGAFRIFSTYGGGLKRQLIYDVYRKIKSNPSEIFLCGSGNEARDVSYVEDQISAILAITDKFDPNGEVWNIGSGVLHTVSEIVSQVCQLLKVNPLIKYEYPMRSYDGVCWRADVRKLEVVGFQQKFSLAMGLKETIAAYEAEIGNFNEK